MYTFTGVVTSLNRHRYQDPPVTIVVSQDSKADDERGSQNVRIPDEMARAIRLGDKVTLTVTLASK
jgi:hypothetical protein